MSGYPILTSIPRVDGLSTDPPVSGRHRNNLRKMFTSSDWIESKWENEQKGKNIANIIFMSSFWNTVVFCLKVSGPLVRVLSLVDGKKKTFYGIHLCSHEKGEGNHCQKL